MKNTHIQNIVVFLITLVILTGIAYLLPTKSPNSNMHSLLIMWTPGIAALITSLITKRSLKLMGWSFSPKWITLGWSIPILYAAISYGLVWVAGLGGVPNPTFLERARLTLGMPHNSNWLVITAAFFFITVVNLIPAMILSLGEELGWRGFLVPELSKSVGWKKAGWISGIIWGIWHLPGIISGQYAANGTPVWFQLFCFLILVISTAVILAWLRMKSNSIWPAAVLHATHNGVIQMFFDRITYNTGHTSYFTGEFGIALVPILILLAWYFYHRSPEGVADIKPT